MENLFFTITIFLLILAIIFPIVLLKILNKTVSKFKFVFFISIELISSILFVLVIAWWNNMSDLLLLEHYGYNINGMSEMEFYGNVAAENLENVKKIEKNIMGIGWPLKAFFLYFFYLPYILIIYYINILLGKK